MQVMSGISVQDGTRVFDRREPATKAAFHEDLKNTPAWARFRKDFGATAENLAQVAPVMKILGFDPDFCSVAQFSEALVTAMDGGRMERRPAAPRAPLVPTDRNGRALTPAQIAWSEMIRFSNTASSSERRERMRVDPAFASFVQKQREQEFQGVGDSLVEANPHLLQQPPPTKGAMANKAAIEFAQRYTSMTADQVRAARSKAINPLTFQSFIDQTEECIRLRLL